MPGHGPATGRRARALPMPAAFGWEPLKGRHPAPGRVAVPRDPRLRACSGDTARGRRSGRRSAPPGAHHPDAAGWLTAGARKARPAGPRPRAETAPATCRARSAATRAASARPRLPGAGGGRCHPPTGHPHPPARRQPGFPRPARTPRRPSRRPQPPAGPGHRRNARPAGRSGSPPGAGEPAAVPREHFACRDHLIQLQQESPEPRRFPSPSALWRPKAQTGRGGSPVGRAEHAARTAAPRTVVSQRAIEYRTTAGGQEHRQGQSTRQKGPDLNSTPENGSAVATSWQQPKWYLNPPRSGPVGSQNSVAEA